MATFANTTNPTAYGIYDSDTDFISDADKVVTFVKRRLGDDILSVELTKKMIWTNFEESALKFSSIINHYQAKSVLFNILGEATGSLSGKENKYPKIAFESARRYSMGVSKEIAVGGDTTMYSASISLVTGQQDYNLQTLLSSSAATNYGSNWNGTDRINVKDIYHFSPVAAYRFFDTSSAMNYLNNEFSFSSFTPETIFYVLPVWEDILRGGQMKLSMKVRRSNYSHEIINNNLRIFPTPTRAGTLWMRYLVNTTVYDNNDAQVSGVANISNAPFGNIDYSAMNSISKQWIRDYTLALCQELLGLVRRKMGSVPIPNGTLTLDGPELVSQGREDQLNLRTKLEEEMESMSYDKLASSEAEMAENVNKQLKFIPNLIWIG
jgi:hypothetical protein